MLQQIVANNLCLPGKQHVCFAGLAVYKVRCVRFGTSICYICNQMLFGGDMPYLALCQMSTQIFFFLWCHQSMSNVPDVHRSMCY